MAATNATQTAALDAANRATANQATADQATADPLVADRAGADAHSISARVSDLVLGRELEFPIYDRLGVLLLASGAMITTEFKRRLIERGVVRVKLHPQDARGMSVAAAEDSEQTAATTGVLGDPAGGIRPPMIPALEAGLPLVGNNGPAAHTLRIARNAEPHDVGLCRQIAQEYRVSVENLSHLMYDALSGSRTDGRGLSRMVTGFLSHFVSDLDATISQPVTMGMDQGLATHCVRMATLGMAIGIELGLNAENVCRIGVAGLIHDWGMLKVPRHIRESSDILSPADMIEIQKHPVYTVDFIERSSGLPTLVALTAYQVHERFDGGGYPRGRSGDKIHLFARILHVADKYVCLTSPQAFRRPLSPYAAMEVLLRQADGRSCDPQVLRGLLRVQSLFPLGSYVQLSDGRTARVLRSNGDDYTRPVVHIVPHSDDPARTAADALIVDLKCCELSIRSALPARGEQPIDGKPLDAGTPSTLTAL